MSMHIITDHPESLLDKLEQQLHHTDASWGVDRQNGYLQRSREADYPYYFRYVPKEGGIEIVFIDVHNQYSTSSVNKYAGELVGLLLTIFTGDALLNHLKAAPYNLPNS